MSLVGGNRARKELGLLSNVQTGFPVFIVKLMHRSCSCIFIFTFAKHLKSAYSRKEKADADEVSQRNENEAFTLVC